MKKTRITGAVLAGRTLRWASVERRAGRLETVGRGEWKIPESESDAAVAARPPDLPRGGVTLGLPSSQVLLRVARLPSSDSGELRGMVELQLDKAAPFPLDTMVFDFEVLDTRDDQSTVLMAAAKNDVLEASGRDLATAGMRSVRVDAAALGLWNAMTTGRPAVRQGRRAALVVGAEDVELILSDGGIPLMFRRIECAEGASAEDQAAAVAADLDYSLMALEMEWGEGALERLTVWHAGPQPEDLLGALRATCSVEVDAASLDRIGTVCEGLARRTAERAGALDLRPAGWVAEVGARAFRRRAIVAAAVFAGLWIAVVGAAFGAVAWERHRLEDLKQRLESGRGPAMDVRETRRRVMTIRRYQDRKTSALECLREMSVRQPAGVIVTRFTYRKGDSLKIAGEADDSDKALEFKRQLDGSGLFLESSMAGPNLDRRRNKYTFGLDLKLPGGAPE